MSAFVVSLVSPVLRMMICGNFKESTDRKLSLDDVDEGLFVQLLQFGCGEAIKEANNVENILQLANLSDRLQMTAITDVLEDRLLQSLNAEACVEMLAEGEASGLKRLQDACYDLVRNQFQEISQMEGFVELSEAMIARLIEEDELGTDREENIFEALVRWITKNDDEGELNREVLLCNIRFGTIGETYLRESVPVALPEHAGLRQLMLETMARKGVRPEEWERAGEQMWDGVARLGSKWCVGRKLRIRILGSDVLRQPRFVAVDRHGRIFVSDSKLHQVIVFDQDGTAVQRIGGKGNGAGRFDAPEGIAVDKEGRIFVADFNNHRVQAFNPDLSFACSFGMTSDTALGPLESPRGVAVDLLGRVVVAYPRSHRICVYNPDGSVALHLGSYGSAAGQLWCPVGVAVDAAGRIVVAEALGRRVQVFNCDGSVALCINSKQDGPVRFDCVQGIAVDREGRLINANRGSNCIQVLNADGSAARVIGREGSGVGEFKSPIGVAVDGAGRILVADTGNGRVQIL